MAKKPKSRTLRFCNQKKKFGIEMFLVSKCKTKLKGSILKSCSKVSKVTNKMVKRVQKKVYIFIMAERRVKMVLVKNEGKRSLFNKERPLFARRSDRQSLSGA